MLKHVLGVLGVVVAVSAVGGVLLTLVDAPLAAYYAFLVALSSAATYQIARPITEARDRRYRARGEA